MGSEADQSKNTGYLHELSDIMMDGAHGLGTPIPGTPGAPMDAMADLDQLDRILEQLSIELISCGVPDCGNLRSTKRKDVRMRIKCI